MLADRPPMQFYTAKCATMLLFSSAVALHSHLSTINLNRPTTQTSYDDLCRLMLRVYLQLSKESKEQEHGHCGTNSNQN